MLFLNSACSAAVLVFYLPVVCTHTDTEGKQRKARVRNILKSSEKNTIFNEHHVCKYNKACQNKCKQRWQGISAILSYVLSNDISILHTGWSRKNVLSQPKNFEMLPPPSPSGKCYQLPPKSDQPNAKRCIIIFVFHFI